MVALAGLHGGCARPIDVQPFATSTAALRDAVRGGGAVIETAIRKSTLPQEERGPLAARFRAAWERRIEMLDAAVQYSDALVMIVERGEARASDGKLIAALVAAVGTAAGVFMPPAGALVAAAGPVAAQVARGRAQARAAHDLQASLDEANDVIQQVRAALAADSRNIDALLGVLRTHAISKIETGGEFLGIERRLASVDDALRGLDLTDPADAARRSALLASREKLQAVREQRDALIADVVRRSDEQRALIAATDEAINRWALAHAAMASAMEHRGPVDLSKLTEAVTSLRELLVRLQSEETAARPGAPHE